MKTAIDISQYLKSCSERIEQHLSQLIPERNVPYHTLISAARYSLLSGGKRLRPILALATTETLGGDVESALTAACALELIHTYSMIHDDLPCMDNDDFRRGKPTLHKVFPEGHAVLTGDFLLTHAFDLIANDVKLEANQRLELIKVLCQCSGGDGMIAGQVLDLQSEGQQIDLDKLCLIHRCKTGAMIRASIEFGGILANTSEHERQLLKSFGEDIGLAFQIVDDILDVTASKEKHGRAISSDLTNDKATYVSLLGLEQSRESAQMLFQSACKTLQQLPVDPTLLISLADVLVNRKS